MVKCKNCNHQLWQLSDMSFEHYTRYYFSHGYPYSTKICYEGNKPNDRTNTCYCDNPEPITITLETDGNRKN